MYRTGKLVTAANVAVLFLVVGFVFTAGQRRAEGYIDAFRPATLGAACVRAESITVMKIDALSKERGVIVLKKVKDLKGALPRSEFRDLLGSAHTPAEKKYSLANVKVGQTAVVFRYENRLAICLGDHWHVTDLAPPKNPDEIWGGATRTEPWFMQTYCGDAKKLAIAVKEILSGKEVIVPTMQGDRDKELRNRTGKMVQLRASLRRKDHTLKRDAVQDSDKAKAASGNE